MDEIKELQRILEGEDVFWQSYVAPPTHPLLEDREQIPEEVVSIRAATQRELAIWLEEHPGCGFDGGPGPECSLWGGDITDPMLSVLIVTSSPERLTAYLDELGADRERIRKQHAL